MTEWLSRYIINNDRVAKPLNDNNDRAATPLNNAWVTEPLSNDRATEPLNDGTIKHAQRD